MRMRGARRSVRAASSMRLPIASIETSRPMPRRRLARCRAPPARRHRSCRARCRGRAGSRGSSYSNSDAARSRSGWRRSDRHIVEVSVTHPTGCEQMSKSTCGKRRRRHRRQLRHRARDRHELRQRRRRGRPRRCRRRSRSRAARALSSSSRGPAARLLSTRPTWAVGGHRCADRCHRGAARPARRDGQQRRDLLRHGAAGNQRRAVGRRHARQSDGMFNGCKRAVQQMITQEPRDEVRGRLINLGSQQGIVTCPGDTPYGVSKAGAIYITRQIAVDYAQDLIVCNCISPGKIVTGQPGSRAWTRRGSRMRAGARPGRAWAAAGHRQCRGVPGERPGDLHHGLESRGRRGLAGGLERRATPARARLSGWRWRRSCPGRATCRADPAP